MKRAPLQKGAPFADRYFILSFALLPSTRPEQTGSVPALCRSRGGLTAEDAPAGSAVELRTRQRELFVQMPVLIDFRRLSRRPRGDEEEKSQHPHEEAQERPRDKRTPNPARTKQ